jgi:hypothetical protein
MLGCMLVFGVVEHSEMEDGLAGGGHYQDGLEPCGIASFAVGVEETFPGLPVNSSNCWAYPGLGSELSGAERDPSGTEIPHDI